TGEKFIPNPFSDDPGSRLYKTGDLVKYLPDGNIEFIGRIDNQVKIRGFRIEPGEIESALSRIKEVREAVVVPKEDSNGNKRLVAYIVSDNELDLKEIRDSLSTSLADYMVPSLFVALDEIPLTPNGKIDRKALPDPEGNFETTNEFIAPGTEIEKKLAGIWCEVLGIKKVGIHDNFFELGGHSLLATQIISKIRKVFSIELPIKALFEAPQISSFSGLIKSSKPGNEISKITPAPREVSPPLSFAQERLWFLDKYEHNSSYNIPGAISLDGNLDIDVLERI
ncbi:MAG: AMP-binding protein, partial [Desulfobacteraceae bacterium]|nr:AMP-binding protein [Desulfobacteraceae bacterium]